MHSRYNFQFSEEHLIASILRSRQQVWWRRPFIGSKWLLVGVCGIILIVVVLKGMVNVAGVIGGVLGILILGWPIDVLLIRKNFRKSPFHNDEIAFTLTEDGAHVVGRNSEVRVGWSSFTKARRFSDGLLLFQGPGLVNWLPDSAAADSTSAACAQELVLSNVPDYRTV